MTPIDLDVSDTISPSETEAIIRGLIAHNEAHAGPASAQDLKVIARRDGAIVGGLIGFTHWNWLHVRFLWVSESMRGQGLGRQLLLRAEDEARGRGCDHAHLDTFSFQALPFYQKLGYVVFGQLDDYSPGATRYFLQKRNLSR